MDLICEKEKKLQHLPGFRFHPTEEELVGFYLRRKVEKKSFRFNFIQDLDFCAFEPWDLPGLAVNGGEREWFFFVKPRGHSDGRPNRITAAGFWKATGTDRPVYTHSTSTLIGLRKTLVFYKGRAPMGHKTDWIMNEYRLYPNERENGGERLCRVYRKATSMKSFDRRPSIQPDKRANIIINNLALDVQLSNSSKFNEVSSANSFAECKCGEEGRLSNLSTPKLELEMSERENLGHLNSLEGWWWCDGGASNSMDTICGNAILTNGFDV